MMALMTSIFAAGPYFTLLFMFLFVTINCSLHREVNFRHIQHYMYRRHNVVRGEQLNYAVSLQTRRFLKTILWHFHVKHGYELYKLIILILINFFHSGTVIIVLKDFLGLCFFFSSFVSIRKISNLFTKK